MYAVIGFELYAILFPILALSKSTNCTSDWGRADHSLSYNVFNSHFKSIYVIHYRVGETEW